jgi:hypothetical protein
MAKVKVIFIPNQVIEVDDETLQDILMIEENAGELTLGDYILEKIEIDRIIEHLELVDC